MALKIAIPEPTSSRLDYNERNTEPYEASLRAVGLEPVLIRSHATPTEVARLILDCQGILLPGSPADVSPQKYGAEKSPETSPADPLRDNLDELLLQDAHNLHKPIFGICYGMQSLNVWRTGTLIQHLREKPINHEAGSKVLEAHQIEIEAGTLLQRLAQAIKAPVNSSHHQAVDQPGDGLKISARSPQDGVIEAIEGTAPDHWIVAVQWHPERTFTTEPLSRRLFEEFARAVRQWKPRVVTESVARN